MVEIINEVSVFLQVFEDLNVILESGEPNMKIKKEFLNETSLKPYGFKKKVLYNNDKYVEYWHFNGEIFIQRRTGEIAVCITGDFDSTDIDDVVYHLIVDGLVEV